jgi:hypothetical protein
MAHTVRSGRICRPGLASRRAEGFRRLLRGSGVFGASGVSPMGRFVPHGPVRAERSRIEVWICR